MKARELAILMVALTAALQPSGARPQINLADLLNNASGGSNTGLLGNAAGGSSAGQLGNPGGSSAGQFGNPGGFSGGQLGNPGGSGAGQLGNPGGFSGGQLGNPGGSGAGQLGNPGGSSAGQLGNPGGFSGGQLANVAGGSGASQLGNVAGGSGSGQLGNAAGGSGAGLPAQPSGFSAGVGGGGAGGELPFLPSPAVSPTTKTGGRSVSSIFVDDNAQLTLLGPLNPMSSGSPTAGTGGDSVVKIVVDDDGRLTLPASVLSGGSGTFPTQGAIAPVSSQGDPGVSGPAVGSSPGQSLGAIDALSSAFANLGQGGVQDFVGGNLGRSFGNTAQSSAGDGLLGALLSTLLGGIGLSGGGQGGGSGQDILGSFAQIASSSLDNIARDANLGKSLIGEEILFQGEEKLRNTFQGIQEAGRVAGQAGQNSYRGALRKKDVLRNLAKDTVGNVGTFADSAVVASVDKFSQSATAFLHLFRDLKGALLNALIAKGQAKKHLVDAQTDTKSVAVDGLLTEKGDVLRSKIRAVTGLSKNLR